MFTLTISRWSVYLLYSNEKNYTFRSITLNRNIIYGLFQVTENTTKFTLNKCNFYNFYSLQNNETENINSLIYGYFEEAVQI